LLERISYSGVSGHVRQFHDPSGKTKRFYLNDLLLYVPCDSNYPLCSMESKTTAVEYDHGAMGEVQAVWSRGQWGFDMGDIGLETEGS